MLAILGVIAAQTGHSLPNLTIPSGWGVNIHFTRPQTGEIEQLASVGFKWVRMDLVWSEVEKRRGFYDFSAYDRLLRTLEARAIRPILILDYGNDLYQQGPPTTPEAVHAFANFASTAVLRYRGRGVLWEIWNEPNIKQFWPPLPNSQSYVDLAKTVGRTIRHVAPGEFIVGPATSTFDWNFLETCFRGGLLELFDAVTVHPYRSENPETVARDWSRLRSLIRNYTSRNVPMFSGEWGYSDRGVSPSRQANYLSRSYLANLASGVPLSIWYDWRDDGPDPKEPEHHFGTVTLDLKPKPALLEASHVIRELGGYTFQQRIASREEVWLLLFRKGSSQRVVGWTTSRQPVTMKLSGSWSSASTRDADKPLRGSTITLTETPTILRR